MRGLHVTTKLQRSVWRPPNAIRRQKPLPRKVNPARPVWSYDRRILAAIILSDRGITVKRFVALATTIGGSALLSLGGATAFAGSSALAQVGGPMIRTHSGVTAGGVPTISENWSGYAATAPKKFTGVSSEFVQPAVTCPGKPKQYTSNWVGLDGFDNETVEQDGTFGFCGGKHNTTPEYDAWYEMYPAGSVNVFKVKPGDVMDASVKSKEAQKAYLKEDTVEYGPLVTRPEKIVCIGLNYRQHAIEIGVPIPKQPVLFNKFNTALNRHNGTIKLPVEYATKFDYEAEMVIAIGREAKEVSEAEALSYVAGYATGNDFTARDLQLETGGQWMVGAGPVRAARPLPGDSRPDRSRQLED